MVESRGTASFEGEGDFSGLTSKELTDLFALQPRMFEDFRESSRGAFETVYAFSETRDNADSVLLRVCEMARKGETRSISLCLGDNEHGYDGLVASAEFLRENGLPPGFPLRFIRVRGNVNTLSEAQALMKDVGSFHGDVGIVAPPFHYTRAFMTMVTAALAYEEKYGTPDVNIFGVTGAPQDWDKWVVHSQGKVENTRLGLLQVEERTRLKEYQAEKYGSLKTPGEVLAYFDKRKASIERQEKEKDRAAEVCLNAFDEAKTGPELERCMNELFEQGALPKAFPEFRWSNDPYWGQHIRQYHPEDNVWEHVRMVTTYLPDSASRALKLATIFHDYMKPATLQVETRDGEEVATNRGHEERGAIEFQKVVGPRLKRIGGISETEAESIREIIRYHGDIHQIGNRSVLSDVQTRQLLTSIHLPELVLLQFADSMGSSRPIAERFDMVKLDMIEEEAKRLDIDLEANNRLSHVFSWVRRQLLILAVSGIDSRGWERRETS